MIERKERRERTSSFRVGDGTEEFSGFFDVGELEAEGLDLVGNVLETENMIAEEPLDKNRDQTDESLLVVLGGDSTARVDAVGDVVVDELSRQIDSHGQSVDDLHAVETERDLGEYHEEVSDLRRMDEFEEDSKGDLVVHLDQRGQLVWGEIALEDELFVGVEECNQLLSFFLEKDLCCRPVKHLSKVGDRLLIGCHRKIPHHFSGLIRNQPNKLNHQDHSS